jgi:sporulation protein YlmC with PRC-barrel domain
MRDTREIRVEHLLGTRVRDATGRVVGRIEEIHTDDKGVVSEFRLGPAALWERLGQSTLELPFIRLLSIERRARRIPWHAIDLTDHEHPIVTTEPGG